MSETTQLSIESLVSLVAAQQQLIEAQQEIIRLQQRIDDLTPKTPPDTEALWHLASGGIMSEEAANSNDLELVRRFLNWNVRFATLYVKPHVDPKVFAECLNQMTRGLSSRIAVLEVANHQVSKLEAPKKTAQSKADKPSRKRLKNIVQIPLAL